MKVNTVFNKALIAGALLSGFSGVTTAQESSSGLVLEEIIVSAQRRDESLQTTPIAVTALNSDALELKQITNILDLQYATPNISIGTNTGTANAARIFIRGTGEDESRATAEPAVGVYVDGIYIGRAVGSLFDLADIERNSNGGAIRVFSRAPSTDENEFDVGITIGSESRFDSKLTGTVVLGDNTAIRG